MAQLHHVRMGVHQNPNRSSQQARDSVMKHLRQNMVSFYTARGHTKNKLHTLVSVILSPY